jgi:hypothetical protein
MPPDLLLLAQRVEFHTADNFWHPGGMPWFAWVAIVGIVSGCVTGLVSTVIRHRERMAMIQLGIHPDTPPPPAPEAVGKPLAREAAEL